MIESQGKAKTMREREREFEKGGRWESDFQGCYRWEIDSHRFKSIGIEFPLIFIDGNRIPIHQILENSILIDTNRWEFDCHQ